MSSGAEPTKAELMEAIERQNIRIHDLECLLAEEKSSVKQTPVIMDTKVEGVSMPKFHGKPHESVDMYFFQAKMFLTCKNIDYKDNSAMNQKRIVAILASNLREGAAAWFHAQAITGDFMSSIEELYKCMKREFVPQDQEHRLREELTSLKQTGSLDIYVAQFREKMSKIKGMNHLDQVHHFTQGLKLQTKREVRYRRCETLGEAIAEAQAYDRAHFGYSINRNASSFSKPRNERKAFPENRQRNDFMDISYSTQVSKKTCIQQKLCFYCKKPGHSIGECRKRLSKLKQPQRTKFNNSVQVKSADNSLGASQNTTNINQFDMSQYARRRYDRELNMELNMVKINKLDTFTNNTVKTPLMIKTGIVYGQQVRILIDSGADHNVIKSSIAPPQRKYNPKVLTTVRRFDGSIIKQKCRILTETISFDSFVFDNVEFTEWPLNQTFDIILGQPWLRRFNPVIDWRTSTISFPIPPLTETRCVEQNEFQKKLKSGQYEELYLLQASKEDKTGIIPNKIAVLLHEFKDIFPEKLPDALPPRRCIEHAITLKADAKPRKGHPFRLSKMENDALDKYVEELLSKNWIEESDSEWLCSIFAVPKKDPNTGQFPTRAEWLKSGNADMVLRWVNDYRYLNSQTAIPKVPLPFIDELFDQMSGCTIFSTIDLASGYHQMRMDPKSKPYTAFRTRTNIYHWNVAPMGLAGMPGTWTRYMNKIFPKSVFPFVVVYLDDICIFSTNEQQHINHLRQVFQQLQKEQLFAKPSKCSFGQSSIEFLGHIVSADGLRMDHRKLEAINQWPTPKNRKDIQRFLGLTGYYRKFIKDFARLLRPISDLVKKDQSWVWGDEQQNAFDNIKIYLTSSPILQLPDYNRQFRVTTDASDYCIGGVLSQLNVNGDDLPIAYYSKKLNKHELNWPTHEKELYAIKSALAKWRPYLYGTPFVVFTDNSACKWFLNHVNLSNKMARWLDFFNSFQFTLHHRPGVDNVVADALSRPPLEDSTVGGDKNTKAVTLSNVVFNVTNDEGWFKELKNCYIRDKVLKSVYKEFKKDSHYEHEEFLFKDDQLLYLKSDNNRLVIPWSNSAINNQLKIPIYHFYHDSPISAHPGVNKTFLAIRQWFYWYKMIDDIAEYIKSCEACKRSKSKTGKTNGHMIPIPLPDYCWQQITWDLIIFLPECNGFDAIMTIVDRLSKRVRYIATRSNIDSTEIARIFFDELVRHHGFPEKIISDRDTKFTSDFWQTLSKIMGIKLSFTIAHRAQADGQSERQNRTLEDSLRCLVAQNSDQWPALLSTIEFAHNSLPHTSTKLSPFEVDTGRTPRFGLNISNANTNNQDVISFVERKKQILQRATSELQKAQERQKKYYDAKRTNVAFKSGDFVFLSTKNLNLKHLKENELDAEHANKRKFLPRWIGPFKVLERLSETSSNYRLELPPHMSRIHPVFNVELLKKDIESSAKFQGRNIIKNLPVIVDNEGERLYIIQALKDKRKIGRRVQYLVQWSGLPDHESSWEFEADIKHVSHWRSLLKDFHTKSF